MNKKELKFILQEGEGLKIEFKENIGSVDKEIVAFANTNGGKIFLGITDDGKIKGIKTSNKLKSQIQDIANNCDPSIKISLEEFDNILIVNVYEGDDKPYKCSSGFYLRQGPNSQKMKRDEIFEFAITEGKIKFDAQLNKNFNFEEDFDKKKLDEYLKLAKIKKNLDVESILLNLGVAIKKNEKIIFNNAGILFFSKQPEKFFSTSKVICVNYQTNEKLNILDKKVFDNGIINNIQAVMNYVKKHIDVEFIIKKLEREEVSQYPEESVRESIINAIMHRNYLDDSEDILIEVFRNKLAVSNPGGLVKGLNPKEFGRKSRTRNSLIANLLLRTGYVEKLGTGINRIKHALRKAGLPEPLFRYNSSFLTELYDKTSLNEKVTDRVTENQRKILDNIAGNKLITARELSKIVNISERKIKENIAKLKQKGYLKRIGPDKGGCWEIIKE